MPGEVTGIDVRTATPGDGRPRSPRPSRRLLGKDYEVRSWEELNKGLFMALKLEKIAMFIVLTFIALVASFSIVSNLIMLVTEKGAGGGHPQGDGRRPTGPSCGSSSPRACTSACWAWRWGWRSGCVGCLLIERFGLPLPTDVYYISKLPVVMRAGEIVTVAALALVLCCLATLYPAVLASRMRPVEGLRYE